MPTIQDVTGRSRDAAASRLRRTLADYAELVRAPAGLSVPGDVVAGAAAAGALGARTPALAGASVLLYWAGMAANDWADRDLDAKERPERPIPSGRIAPGQALAVAAGLTVAGVAVARAAGGRRALTVAVPLAAAVWAYDVKAKNTAAGPAVMAACRGLDVLLGATGGRTARALAGGAAGRRAHVHRHRAVPPGGLRRRPPPADRHPGGHRGGDRGRRPAGPATGLACPGAGGAGRLVRRPLRRRADPGGGRSVGAAWSARPSVPASRRCRPCRARSPPARVRLAPGALVAAAAPLARRLTRKVAAT